MRNFGTLFRFEMRKIWTRGLTWAAVVLLVAVCVVDASLFAWAGQEDNGYQFEYTAEDGTEYSAFLTGYEQTRREGVNGTKLDGQVWDEAYFTAMRESLPQVDGNWFQLDCWLYLVDPTYFASTSMVWSLQLDPTTVTAEEFYEARRELARQDWVERQELTPAEISYWETRMERIPEPFRYEYCKGTKFALSHFQSMGILLPIGLAAMLSGVFAEEKRTRTLPLLFVSSFGRLPLALAKILAGVVSAAIAAVCMVAATVVPELVLLGGGLGFGAPVQMCEPLSGLALSVGGALLVLTFLLIVYAALCAAGILLLSVLTGSSVATLAISFLPVLGSVYMLAWWRPLERWANWLPMNVISSDALSNGHLLGPLNLPQSGALLYGALAAALFFLCVLGWRRWAVRGK